MFIKSEPSPLDTSYPVINSRFKLACIRSLAVLSNHVACNRAQIASKPPNYAGFKQALVFFWPPDVINFLLKSLSVVTSIQSKQMCSFDDLEMHTRSIVLVGVEPISFAIHKVI